MCAEEGVKIGGK